MPLTALYPHRTLGSLLRRADAALLDGAARNAAAGVRDHQARRLDEARTLRDLHRVTTRRDLPTRAARR